ncbi:MAG TPA: tetratricopeptide repeat protein [Acidobacteriaceae bacterium]|nr:tetratricopeptide repeat protein [Acidobacteriaceae bacterium]
MRPNPPLRSLLFTSALALLSALFAPFAHADNNQTAAETATLPAKVHHQLLLVLPFDNRTGQANLDWIGEAVSEIANQRLGASGFDIISRGDRQYALEHLGLPRTFEPSRATAIRLAQTLDADDIIVGFYTLENNTLHVSAQILDVNALRLGQPLVQDGPLDRMLDVLNSLAWHVVRSLDGKFPLPESSFQAASSNLRLNGFENYIRGIIEPEPAERIRHLKIAVAENPTYSPAWLALGMTYFSEQQFDASAAALGHMRKNDPAALEAEFYRGIAFFYTGHYDEAEEAFAFVAGQLPLPEVVNDQGVAASRRGHDGGALFQEAIDGDPHDADYNFNLAIALARRGDTRNALAAVAQALKLRPQDSEALALQNMLQQPKPPAVVPASVQNNSQSGSAAAPGRRNLPLERIKRSYNDASFRQAASEMEEMEAQHLASLPSDQQAATLSKNGKTYLGRGLMLEAERQFQLALAANGNDADAHAGLAEVRRRNGDNAQARAEAQAAIKLRPSAEAWLTLARLDRTEHHLPAAREDVNHALQVEPNSSDARGLQQALAPAVPAAPSSPPPKP